MARNLEIDETIFIPLPYLKCEINYPSAFYQTKVLRRDVGKNGLPEPQITVLLPDKSECKVHTNIVYRTIQFLVIIIGDHQTEETLLNPLAKSITSFLRILIPGDQLKIKHIRTRAELAHIWNEQAILTSHLIVIGHGSSTGIGFWNGDTVGASDLNSMLIPSGERKVFISLCCQTGDDKFAEEISKNAAFSAYIAPTKNVHGCIASQFTQTFISYITLETHLIHTAWKKASKSTPIDPIFSCWIKGIKQTIN